MDIHSLNSVLQNYPNVKAPEGFTEEVMRKIYLSENQRNPAPSTSIRIRYRQWGLSCLAAGLLILLLNLSPYSGFLNPPPSHGQHQESHILSPNSLSQPLNNFTTKASRLFTESLDNLKTLFIKED